MPEVDKWRKRVLAQHQLFVFFVESFSSFGLHRRLSLCLISWPSLSYISLLNPTRTPPSRVYASVLYYYLCVFLPLFCFLGFLFRILLFGVGRPREAQVWAAGKRCNKPKQETEIEPVFISTVQFWWTISRKELLRVWNSCCFCLTPPSKCSQGLHVRRKEQSILNLFFFCMCVTLSAACTELK